MKNGEKNVYVGIVIALIVVVVVLGFAFTKLGRNNGNNGGSNGGSGNGGDTGNPSRGDWQVIPVPGGKCGDGEEYVMGFNPGPDKINGQQNNRIVIWLPGGGSTMITRDGGFTTNVGFGLGLITPPKQFSDENHYIFLDHPDNNDFVKDANWVILPYCTQDFHSGTLTEPIEYDFTSETQMVNVYEKLLNDNKGKLSQLQAKYPYIKVQTHDENGKIVIDKLQISIIHDGAKNIELGLNKMFELLNSRGFDLDNAEVIMAGSSAGAFGTWYNAWRVGDRLYSHPNAKFTIVAESGSPSIRRWDGNDISVDPEEVADVNYRLTYYNNINPCEQNGGAYHGGDDCKDVFGLIDHYQNRYPNMDLAIMPVSNKEDLVLVSGLGDPNAPGFDAKLLNLCQTIHRYSQYIYKIDNVFPYTLWQYKKVGNKENRVHGLTNSLLTVPMVSPNARHSDDHGILKMINDVAMRKLSQDHVAHIEYTLNVVTNPDAKDSSTVPMPDHLPECDVSWPERNSPN